MATVITIANQKGGVAKTTTTRHLGYFLDQAGVKTLIIDNDHQANLTQYFGLDPIECENQGTMYDVIIGRRTLSEVIVKVSENVHVAPSSLSLAEAGARLIHETDVNGVLKQALRSIQDDYDVVLIDCGPNLERLLINALVASKLVLIPTKTDSLSISGIPALMQTVQKVRTGSLNPSLELLGVLPTIYHQGRQADEKALGRLRDEALGANIRVFDPIPAATNYDKAADLQKSVFEIYPETAGKSEYEYLAGVISSF